MNESTPRDSVSGSAREKVRSTAADLASSAREQAANLTGKAMDTAEREFESRKSGALGEINSFAGAMRSAGDRLRSDQSGSHLGAILVTTVADRLESLGHSLEGKTLDAVFGDVENFARRNPAAFVGTAAALGFLASRFLKSSSRRSHTYGGFEEATAERTGSEGV